MITPLGIIAIIAVCGLTGGALWTMALAAVKRYQALEAQKQKALMPVRLLRQQDELICDLIAEGVISPEARDRMILLHQEYVNNE